MLTVHQRHIQTDGRTTYDSNTALALRASRGNNNNDDDDDDDDDNNNNN